MFIIGIVLVYALLGTISFGLEYYCNGSSWKDSIIQACLWPIILPMSIVVLIIVIAMFIMNTVIHSITRLSTFLAGLVDKR